MFWTWIILVTAAVFLVTAGWALKARASDDRVGAILGGAAVIFIGLISASVAHYTAIQKEVQAQHRLQKLEAYSKFTDLMVGVFEEVKKRPSEDNMSDDDVEILARNLQSDYFDAGKRLLLWASPEVIHAYHDWRDVSLVAATSEDPALALRVLCHTDLVLEAMREDLDLDNSSLRRGQLIGVFLSDPPEIKAAIKDAC